MNPVLSSVQSMREMFVGKMQDFIDEIKNVHIVWLEEIQQEANRMFSRDFNTEPELMPKTPSQKKNSRRKRVSVGRHEENQTRRRFSKGRRSNLRGSSVKSLNFIAEEECVPEASKPKRTTRKKKQTMFEETEDVSQVPKTEETENEKPVGEQGKDEGEDNPDSAQPPPELPAPEVAPSASADQSLPDPPAPEVTVSISSTDRLSAENAKILVCSPGRTATKVAIADVAQSSRRSSVQCSLKLRHSLAGLRHSMTQESVRRASRRSMLKRKVARTTSSQCSSNNEEDAVEEEGEVTDTEDNAAEGSPATSKAEEPVDLPVRRVTRSVAANSPKLALPSLCSAEQKMSTPNRKPVVNDKAKSGRRSRQSTKRKAPDTAEESPTKRFSPPKKSQSAIRPNMRSFLHTVQKNQMLMMTPNTLGRTGVIKSFIKHTTPLRIDPKLSDGVVTKERYKLEALKKKQEQEEERMKKMEEEKKRKQEELKRKRDERLKRVFEAKVKEEQKEEEKKKKVEQKMAQIEVKNERLAEEKAKKKAAVKRQEELEKKKLEEEARKKKMEEEKRQLELLVKKKAEEEEHARKLAEARRALELRREQERERERQLERQLERERERQLERERLAAAERERVEKEKALALQRELERAAREKERRELEEKRKALEERRKLEEQLRLAAEQKAAKEREAAKQKEAAAKQNTTALNVTVDIERSVLSTPVGKGTGLNVTVDVEKSPQSYVITPKGGNKPVLSKTAEDYGMDQNSDDSTDDESAPRKPIPSWAENHNLNQSIMKQYFNPPALDSFFGVIEPPKLEHIFYKSKPRYFKRTSSAVWHLPPTLSK